MNAHIYFRPERYITTAGLPARHNASEPCVCASLGNHATPPVAQ